MSSFVTRFALSITRICGGAKQFADVPRRWSASVNLGAVSIRYASLAIIVLIGSTYVVVHWGRAVPEVPKLSKVVAPPLVEFAAHPEPPIKPATSSHTATSKSQPADSEPEIRWLGKKPTQVSGAQHSKTPVVVAGEAPVNSQPDGAQVRLPSKSVLNVTSTPSGATILLDGKSTSLTSPAELPVSANGRHTITLVHLGFLTAESEVNIRDGESSSVAIKLVQVGNAANSKVIGGIKRLLPGGSSKEMASVQFKTNPKGARLMLNGWPAPKTTPLELRLPPGGYIVSIRADGFKPFSRKIVVEAGQKVIMQEALERSSSLAVPK
jgi:hypothetical protein